MKIRSTITVGFVLLLGCLSTGRAQVDAELREEIREVFQKADTFAGAKDLNGFMSLFAEDFELIPAGLTKEGTRESFDKFFKANDEIWADHMLLDISRAGDKIRVICDEIVKGRSGDGGWQELAQSSVIYYLIRDGDSLKFFRAAEVDRSRLKCINRQTYRNETSGFSFTAPENWTILPSKHPTMEGVVNALAPDMSSVTLFGYVNLPSTISARQVLEGEEMATEKASQKGTYNLFKSGPIEFKGYEGFETESEFQIPAGQARHRRRVYFHTGDRLFVLCFDAIPPQNWDAVKDDFQSILDSIKLTGPAK
jgi:ketosteroid isomerase-like protein